MKMSLPEKPLLNDSRHVEKESINKSIMRPQDKIVTEKEENEKRGAFKEKEMRDGYTGNMKQQMNKAIENSEDRMQQYGLQQRGMPYDVVHGGFNHNVTQLAQYQQNYQKPPLQTPPNTYFGYYGGFIPPLSQAGPYQGLQKQTQGLYIPRFQSSVSPHDIPPHFGPQYPLKPISQNGLEPGFPRGVPLVLEPNSAPTGTSGTNMRSKSLDILANTMPALDTLPLTRTDVSFKSGRPRKIVDRVIKPRAKSTPGISDERPFACKYEGCDWAFARHSDLRRHARSHSEPMFHCPFWENDHSCHRNGGAFNRLDVLKRHLRLVHFVQDKHPEARNQKPNEGWCRACQKLFPDSRSFVDHCFNCEKVSPTLNMKMDSNTSLLSVNTNGKLDDFGLADNISFRTKANTSMNASIYSYDFLESPSPAVREP